MKGYLLIESSIGLALLLVILGSSFSFLSSSLGMTKIVQNQALASFLASEGIEVVKNIIDSNIINFRAWNQGLSDGEYEVQYDSENLSPYQNRFLKLDKSTDIYSYTNGENTFFKRKIKIKNINSDEIQVNSIVSFKLKGGDYEVNLEDHFFNWRP